MFSKALKFASTTAAMFCTFAEGKQSQQAKTEYNAADTYAAMLCLPGLVLFVLTVGLLFESARERDRIYEPFGLYPDELDCVEEKEICKAFKNWTGHDLSFNHVKWELEQFENCKNRDPFITWREWCDKIRIPPAKELEKKLESHAPKKRKLGRNTPRNRRRLHNEMFSADNGIGLGDMTSASATDSKRHQFG